jgi:hypothetical protein
VEFPITLELQPGFAVTFTFAKNKYFNEKVRPDRVYIKIDTGELFIGILDFFLYLHGGEDKNFIEWYDNDFYCLGDLQ